MLDAPERIGARFSILLFLGFLLTPLVGFGAAVLFGILSPGQLQQLLAGGIVPAFSVSLIFLSLFQLQRLVTPLISWVLQNPEGGNAPTHLHKLSHRFSRAAITAPRSRTSCCCRQSPRRWSVCPPTCSACISSASWPRT
jgi:hypothetical protein